MSAPLNFEDLNPDEQCLAGRSAEGYAAIEGKYPNIKLPERESLRKKYEIFLTCTYCEANIAVNFLDGMPTVCPECKRKSVGLEMNPARAAAWLVAHYDIITTTDANQIMYLYDERKGVWSDERAVSIITHESKILFGESLSTQKLTNTFLHVRAMSYMNAAFAGCSVIIAGELLLNVNNGVLNTKTKKLGPHSKEYLFLSCLNVEYDEAAKCPKIAQFLKDITEDNIVMAAELLEAMAYTLMPGYPIQKAIMLVGSGGNGKSTFLGVLTALLGKENVSNVKMQELTGRFALPRLIGKVANIAADLPSRAILDGGVFKALTGGDDIEAESKYMQRTRKFQNTAKIFFSANKIPDIDEDSVAYFRRWYIIEFKAHFSDGKEILPELVGKEELSGLLNILLAVALPTLQQSLRFTFAKEVEVTRSLYLKNSNTVKAFAEECLDYDPDAAMPKSEFYEKYLEYCKRYSLLELSDRGFWRELKKVVTYDERQPERGMPRWIYGQAVKNPEKESASITSISSVISLIVLYYPYLPMFTTIRENIDETDETDANHPTSSNTILENPENPSSSKNMEHDDSQDDGTPNKNSFIETPQTFQNNGTPTSQPQPKGAPSTNPPLNLPPLPTLHLLHLQEPPKPTQGNAQTPPPHTTIPPTQNNAPERKSEQICPICGKATARLYDYDGQAVCVDCLNAAQHQHDDNDVIE